MVGKEDRAPAVWPLVAVVLLLLFAYTASYYATVRRTQGPPPGMKTVVRVSAQVYGTPELSIEPVESIRVPVSGMPLIVNLVTPTTTQFEINPERNYHLADVYLEHTDGTVTTVAVRHTGHNPAAVSIDGKHYFLGGSDPFPNGAIRVVRLLNVYHAEREQHGDSGT